jgi:hypothetical protein
MTPIIALFNVEKETKGTIKYQEVDEAGVPSFAAKIGTLYVKKSNFPDGKFPKDLRVTIEAK